VKVAKGKTSMDWFFRLIFFYQCFWRNYYFFYYGNLAGNNLATIIKLFSNLKGWAFANKAFINQKVMQELLSKGLVLVTGIRQNIKKTDSDKQILYLQKSGMSESVNDVVESICDIDNTRHQSPINTLVNLYAGLYSHDFLDRLPFIF
jgi:hypothetical protein